MTIRIGGALGTIKIAESDYNRALGTMSSNGTGHNSAQVVTGDGVKNLLQLLKDSGFLEEISSWELTVDDPPGTRGPEEAGLAFIPQNGTEVEIFIGVQVRCVEPQ